MTPKTGATWVAKPVRPATLPRWDSGSRSAVEICRLLRTVPQPHCASTQPRPSRSTFGAERHHDQRDHADEHAADHERPAAADAGARAVAPDAHERRGEHHEERAGAGDVAEVLLVAGGEVVDADGERDRQRGDEGHEDAELRQHHEPDVASVHLGQVAARRVPPRRSAASGSTVAAGRSGKRRDERLVVARGLMRDSIVVSDATSAC